MHVWFVTPAFGRVPVTRLALAQRAALAQALSRRGVTIRCVVVADDDNLEVAAEHGFDHLWCPNEPLGEKVNAGFRYAAEHGADYISFIGSDNWMHEDLFEPLFDVKNEGKVISGNDITVVDLENPRARTLGNRGRDGVAPWLIPRRALERCEFQPMQGWKDRGLDYSLALALRTTSRPTWVFHDPHPLARVDFKSQVGMTKYDAITQQLGRGPERDPFDFLAEKYHPDLVDLARETHLEVTGKKKTVSVRRTVEPEIETAVGKKVWFVVPAHGRVDLSRVCLAQLADAIDTLREHDVDAEAVVIADDENLETAEALGFATVEQKNDVLGRKWNDGYELACRAGDADYVIPFGSDDWFDPHWLLSGRMPRAREVRCMRQSAVVNEDCTRLARLWIPYRGGDGVRVIPTTLLGHLNYRPAHEDRPRAIDTSTLQRLGKVTVFYHEVHPLQVVDFKSGTTQLNTYDGCLEYLQGRELVRPWRALSERYPAEHIQAMRKLVSDRLVAV